MFDNHTFNIVNGNIEDCMNKISELSEIDNGFGFIGSVDNDVFQWSPKDKWEEKARAFIVKNCIDNSEKV